MPARQFLLLLAAIALPLPAAAQGPAASGQSLQLLADIAPRSAMRAGNSQPPEPWQLTTLPRQRHAVTRFSWTEVDGEASLVVRAEASYGNLVHKLGADQGRAAAGGAILAWRWRLAEPNPSIDLRRRDGDDTNLKVCVLFDLPLGAVPMSERFVLQIARQRAGDALPAATICYVWDSQLARDSRLDNPYSRRVRYWVLRGPSDPLHAWVREERDISADFRRLFGAESEVVPPIIGVAVGADADNTGAASLAFLNQLTLTLTPKSPPP